MKVLFVNPGQEMGGIQCLSAYLKERGHSTDLVQDPRLFDNAWVHFPKLEERFHRRDELVKNALAKSPDLFAFSVVADDFLWAFQWAELIKQHSDVPIVFGNIGPTADPAATLANKNVDFIVRGEGEETLYELTEALQKQKGYENILGLGYKNKKKIKINSMRPLIQDMDSLPFPDKDLFYETASYFNFGYTTMTGRGCPYACTFCDNTTSRNIYKSSGQKGKWPRRQSPERVIAELKWAKEKYDINHIRFNDEDFSYNKIWVREFCERYIESKLNVNWFAWVYPNTVDLPIARLMKDAGCDSVEMGVQSGSSRIRHDIMRRKTSNESIIKATNAFREVNIRCTIDIIVGSPTEEKADLDETVDLIAKSKPFHIYVPWLRYYDSTEILDMAVKNQWLNKNQILELTEKRHTRGHLGGGTELEKNSLTRKYHSFITLMPILPLFVIKFLRRHDLIKYFPHFNSILLVNLTKTFKPNQIDEFRTRVIRMYIQEIAKGIKRFFNKIGHRVLSFIYSCREKAREN